MPVSHRMWDHQKPSYGEWGSWVCVCASVHIVVSKHDTRRQKGVGSWIDRRRQGVVSATREHAQ